MHVCKTQYVAAAKVNVNLGYVALQAIQNRNPTMELKRSSANDFTHDVLQHFQQPPETEVCSEIHAVAYKA